VDGICPSPEAGTESSNKPGSHRPAVVGGTSEKTDATSTRPWPVRAPGNGPKPNPPGVTSEAFQHWLRRKKPSARIRCHPPPRQTRVARTKTAWSQAPQAASRGPHAGGGRSIGSSRRASGPPHFGVSGVIMWWRASRAELSTGPELDRRSQHEPNRPPTPFGPARGRKRLDSRASAPEPRAEDERWRLKQTKESSQPTCCCAELPVDPFRAGHQHQLQRRTTEAPGTSGPQRAAVGWSFRPGGRNPRCSIPPRSVCQPARSRRRGWLPRNQMGRPNTDD